MIYGAARNKKRSPTDKKKAIEINNLLDKLQINVQQLSSQNAAIATRTASFHECHAVGQCIISN